jgi:nitrite reductase/ring-hydroxylating ferredoxin subunit
MAEASFSAQIQDLLPDPRELEVALRPTVERACAIASPGSVVPAQREGRPVALVVLEDGRTYTVPDRCPHDGGPLSDGFVEHGRLVCARHYWEFDLCSGGECPARRSPRQIVAEPVT